LTISGLLASSGLVGVGKAETDLGLTLFGFGSTDEKIFQDIANYKEEVRRQLNPFFSFINHKNR
jgi:hypothetical protein